MEDEAVGEVEGGPGEKVIAVGGEEVMEEEGDVGGVSSHDPGQPYFSHLKSARRLQNRYAQEQDCMGERLKMHQFSVRCV